MIKDRVLAKAAITLEAAIVLPICLFATTILILIVLVFHDYAVLVSHEHHILEEYCTLEPNFGKVYDLPITIKEITTSKKPMLFIGKGSELTYKISVSEYVVFKKVKVESICQLSLMGIDLTYHHESTQVVTSGPEVVRLMEFMNDLTSDHVLLAQMKQYFDYGIKAIEAVIESR